MPDVNLNTWGIDHDDRDYERAIGAESVNGDTIVYFDDLESRLIQHIQIADVIVGCVAWLTSFSILDALAKKKSVSILVQKEDFLRPDIETPNDWKTILKKKYQALPDNLDHNFMPGTIGRLTTNSRWDMGAVRAVGNLNADKAPAFPRSHHKFVVFMHKNPEPSMQQWLPYAVWTGSFNFTKNATKSFENALYLTDPNIVWAYYQEFGHIYGVSEPLDWNTKWSMPYARIGT